MDSASHEIIRRFTSSVVKLAFFAFNLVLIFLFLGNLVDRFTRTQEPQFFRVIERLIGGYPSFLELLAIWLLGVLALGCLAYATRGARLYPPRHGGI
jgi:hypothetical protein